MAQSLSLATRCSPRARWRGPEASVRATQVAPPISQRPTTRRLCGGTPNLLLTAYALMVCGRRFSSGRNCATSVLKSLRRGRAAYLEDGPRNPFPNSAPWASARVCFAACACSPHMDNKPVTHTQPWACNSEIPIQDADAIRFCTLVSASGRCRWATHTLHAKHARPSVHRRYHGHSTPVNHLPCMASLDDARNNLLCILLLLLAGVGEPVSTAS